MEKIIEELKKLVPFKDTLAAGDIVLLAAKKPQILVYALVENIVRDDSKRDEWWYVTMNILALPPRKVTWILRTAQMTGFEVFTMDGEARFMKAVDFGKKHQPAKAEADRKKKGRTTLHRIK